MTHADPWDEIARLEQQMDSELAGQREGRSPDLVKRPRSRGLSPGGRAAFTSLIPRDTDVERK